MGKKTAARVFRFATPEDMKRFNDCVTTRETEPRDMNGGLGPCWIFQPPKGQKGQYPQFRFGDEVESAHLFLLEQSLGRLLYPGMEADHLCHDPVYCKMTNACIHTKCVRRAHLAEAWPVRNNAADRKLPSRVAVQQGDTTVDPIYAPTAAQVINQVRQKKAKLMAENIIAKEEADAGYKKTMDDLAKLKASDEALPESYFEGHRHTQKPFIDPTDVMKGRVEHVSPGAGPSLFYTIGAKTEPEKMLHDPPREGDWYEVGCRRSDCENSPYRMMLFGLDPEDWRKVDMEDGVMYPHSHRYHDEDVTSKAERSVLRELKERLKLRLRP